MKIEKLIATALVATAVVAPAHAGHFLFQYNWDAQFSDPTGPKSASMDLVTSDTLNSIGGYDILSASGTIDGAAVLGLKLNPTQPNFSADGVFIYNNVIYPTGAPIDPYGFVVNTAGGEFNFGYDGNQSGGFFAILADGSTHVNSHGDVVPNYRVTVGSGSLAAVPEPASWAMMLAGFGLAGAAMRRRRAVVSFG